MAKEKDKGKNPPKPKSKRVYGKADPDNRKRPGPRKRPVGPPDPPGSVPPGDPSLEPLSPDEQRFVEEWLVDRSSARAYRTCFPGCSHHAARNHGWEMRHRPNVDREIRAAVHAQSIRTQVTADRALKELARVAFSDVIDLYDPVTHQLRHPRHIPFEARRAIASIKVGRTRTTTRSDGQTETQVAEHVVAYTLWPKMDALGKICRHLGMDTEITPLEALLQALPRELAAAVRQALAAPREVKPSTNGHHPPAGERM